MYTLLGQEAAKISEVKVTPHLNEKFLSTNSPWDFEGGIGTIEPNWVYPENIFANKSTGCGTIYWWKNYIPSNVSNPKNSNTFTLKTFWDRQFCFYENFWFFSQNSHFWGASPFFGRFTWCALARIEHLIQAEKHDANL